MASPPVVVVTGLPGETSEVTDVTVLAPVDPTAKNNTCLHTHYHSVSKKLQ